MREYNVKAAPISFLTILDIKKEEELNCHGKMTMTGYISDDEEEECLKILRGDVWEKIEAVGEKGDKEILFWGLVTDFSIERINDQKKMTLEITTGSCLLDREVHMRSFQNQNMTYKEIFRQICGEYEVDIIFESSLEDKTGQLVLQYAETDWEFFKRLSSRKNKFLVPESKMRGTRLFYGLPRGKKIDFSNNWDYKMQKDLAGFYRKKSNGILDISESDCLAFIFQVRENYRIGDYMEFQGIQFYIYKIISKYIKGEMIHEYYLMQEKGLAVPGDMLKNAAGCSLDAMVKEVKRIRCR